MVTSSSPWALTGGMTRMMTPGGACRHIVLPRRVLEMTNSWWTLCRSLLRHTGLADLLQLLDVPLGNGHAGEELLHMDAVAASVGTRPGACRRAMRRSCRSWCFIASSGASGHLEEDLR